jgi:spoIIIJ-associated protein
MLAPTDRRGQQWLEKLLLLAGLKTSVSIAPAAVFNQANPLSEHWLVIETQDLTPQQIQTAIGKDGITIDAIQYLANSILNINQPPEEQAAYTVEINGYRLQRLAALTEMAEQAARTVRETGQEFMMKPLSAAERRQVHTMLEDAPDLETFSRGQEPDRRLVVKLR